MDFYTLIGCITATVAICWYIAYYHYILPYSFFKKLNIPGPKPYIILGNLLHSRYAKRHECLIDYARKYGKVFGLYYGKLPMIHVADADIANEILIKQSENFINRVDIVPNTRKTVGLIDARDSVWKDARECLSPLFSPTKLKVMAQFTNEASENLLSKVMQAIDKHDDVMDMKKLFYSTAMEMSLASLFGVKPDEDKRNDLEKYITNFIRALESDRSCLGVALPSIYKSLALILQFHQVQGIINIMKILGEIVRTRRQDLQNGMETRTDMLKLVIEAEYKDKIIDRDVLQHCFTFLVGGYDTTASTLTFVVFALATNPDIQDKVIEEIDRCCPDETCLTYNDMQKLTYLDMVVNEALRYFSPGYILLREAKKDCTIKGIHFPKDVGIAIAAKCIHADPDIWENPTRFDPERFSAENKAKRHPCSYIPFGDGPRKCIGNRLGLMNVKLILARLFQHVRFDVAEKTEIPLPTIVLFTAVPENPVYFKVMSRY